MDIVLPVAGFGTRLRPQTWSRPKPLVSVAGKPMLGHVLDDLSVLNPDNLVFVTGFLGDQIREWVTKNYETPSHFIEQPQMLGQSDAILRARDIVRGDALVLFPDMLFEIDFSPLRNSDADVVIFTKEVDDPSAYGIAIEEEGQVTRLIEKPSNPESNQAVIGVYYFRHMPDLYAAMEKQMQEGISLKNEYFIADAVQLMINEGARVVTAPVDVWQDCGNENALLASNKYLLDRNNPDVPSMPGTRILRPTFVHREASVENSELGPHVSVGAGARVIDSQISNSIVEEGATIVSSKLHRSVVGKKARVFGIESSVNVGDLSRIGDPDLG